MSELGAGGTWCARRGILSQSLIGSCYKSSINQTAPLPTEVELDASAYDVWHDRAALWTSKGLFRLAALQHDESFKQQLCEHVSGSLLNFLEHASPGGQIPIMMTADSPDAFRIPGKDSTSRNQAKPVFGQLALLACDQRGDANWLEPQFNAILRFYDSGMKHNSSRIGLLVWGDDVAIGDDNDPTTFGRPFSSSANLLSIASSIRTCWHRRNSHGDSDARRIITGFQARRESWRNGSRSSAGIPEMVTTTPSMSNVSIGGLS
jgi:hypothetical protein